MFLPIGTDRPLRTTPWLNIGLILVNVAAFLITGMGQDRETMWPMMLHAAAPTVRGFITYQFLHEGWGHLLGNMLFLFVFGNSVEDRLGKLGYLAFYLGGGVFAGLGHVVSSDLPVIGASGSVCAVTGLYLMLFPLSNVTVVVWFFMIFWFKIPSLVLILFQIGQNLLFGLGGDDAVAYAAHLAGYVWGILTGIVLLGGGILSREPYDLLAMWEHRRRHRRQGPVSRDAAVREPIEPASPHRQRLAELRSRIAHASGRGDLAEAAADYLELLELDSQQVLPARVQLELANQLMTQGDPIHAAKAYEAFLAHHHDHPQAAEVRLMLALIDIRYLNRPGRGRTRLVQIMDQLSPAYHDLASQLMMEAATRLGGGA